MLQCCNLQCCTCNACCNSSAVHLMHERISVDGAQPNRHGPDYMLRMACIQRPSVVLRPNVLVINVWDCVSCALAGCKRNFASAGRAPARAKRLWQIGCVGGRRTHRLCVRATLKCPAADFWHQWALSATAACIPASEAASCVRAHQAAPATLTVCTARPSARRKATGSLSGACEACCSFHWSCCHLIASRSPMLCACT